MISLHIEHATPNFDAWKATFDSKAELRQKSGVRFYRISRLVDNPNMTTIDLEFDKLSDAQTLLVELQQLWQHVTGTLILNPQWRLSEVIETKAQA